MDQDIMIDLTENEQISNLPISRIYAIVQNSLRYISSESIAEARETLDEVRRIVRVMLAQESIPGVETEWHNFAVQLAKNDLYDLCCDVLEKALELFENNTDLLADYLKYGVSCGRIEQCRAYYAILARIPKVRYTWRAYSFAIDWLQYLWKRSKSEKEMEKLQKEMQALIPLFRSYLPDDEESYCSEADVYEMLHRYADLERVLRQALQEQKRAPKCAMRLADMLFERGEAEEALTYIERCIRDSNDKQMTVNEGYLYYLKGLTIIAIAMNADNVYDAKMANEIYENFETALKLSGGHSVESGTIKNKAIIVSKRSGEPVDEALYPELAYLVNT